MTCPLRLVPTPRSAGPLLLDAPVHYVGSAAATELEADDLAAHHARYGTRPAPATAAQLIDDLACLGLTGRGGGHFPAAVKWQAIATAQSRPAVIVANGAEGEPLSEKDAALLELRPHLVLDGLAVAAEAFGAGDTIVWLHDGALAVRRAVAHAVAERRRAGLRESIRIQTGPDRYLSGESSAVVRALGGGPALPEYRRESAARSGVQGRPTLVHNVETLARVALAARGLPATASSLITVAGREHRVVTEVPSGTTVREGVTGALGAMSPYAVLLGGYGGSWAQWADVADLQLDEPSLRAAGRSLGAGVLLPLSAAECGLARVAEIARYLADSSARQCGPCLFGLAAVAELVESLADRQGRRRDPARLRRFLGEIHGRGACHHPDGAVRMIATALDVFADDVQAHLRGRCLHRGARHG